jgi:hypothetical protein
MSSGLIIWIVIYLIGVYLIQTGLKRVTIYSRLQCIIIGLTTSIPMILNKIVGTIETVTLWLVEVGLTLGGSSSAEIKHELKLKSKLPEDEG